MSPQPGAVQAALAEWRRALGADRVRSDETVLAGYARDTSDFSTAAAAVVRPLTTDEVCEVVRIAGVHGVPLYPISTGRNWGYGSGNPPVDGCVIVDLGGMTALSFDADLGLVTVEPGVTQGMLREWLDRHNYAFMVPATGAGPSVSILSNALERGYGITPITDHASSVISLEAVLADASLYRSPLRSHRGAEGFRWGLGPYLDGLFSQGTAGIVTNMTLALARMPERVEAFYFWLEEDETVADAAIAVRSILQQAGGSVGGINLMSAMRVMAMSQPYPADVPAGEAVPEEFARELARSSGVGAWMGVGAIYGTRRHAAATRALVRRELKGVASRLLFMTGPRARLLSKLTARIPATRRLSKTLSVMAQAIDLMHGEPSEATLPLAYWKTRRPRDESGLNPARDGAGILWYSPVMSITGNDVQSFVEMVRRVCAEHGFEAPITLTTVSERTFDCTLPVLFDAMDPTDAARADACWRALFEAGRDLGYHPYRLHHRYTGLVVDESEPFWRVVGDVTRTLDPRGILAPGRWVDPR